MLSMSTDWVDWHRRYDDPGSALSRRLRIVQAQVVAFLNETAPAPVKVVSACAGEGRDLLEVLADRRDGDRVDATLLEYDDRNVARATGYARRHGLNRITVTRADAGRSDAYTAAVPADLVMMCGIFGNINDEAVRRLIGALPRFCGPGATVLWTRHRRPPDLTGPIRRWLMEAGFEEVSFIAPDGELFSVGRHRLVGEPAEFVPGLRLFDFIR